MITLVIAIQPLVAFQQFTQVQSFVRIVNEKTIDQVKELATRKRLKIPLLHKEERTVLQDFSLRVTRSSSLVTVRYRKDGNKENASKSVRIDLTQITHSS